MIHASAGADRVQKCASRRPSYSHLWLRDWHRISILRTRADRGWPGSQNRGSPYQRSAVSYRGVIAALQQRAALDWYEEHLATHLADRSYLRPIATRLVGAPSAGPEIPPAWSG
jgi:hypothetical protein